MPFVGPYQQYVLEPTANVARVQDWNTQASAITAGITQGKNEAVAAAATDATARSAAALTSAKQYTRDTMDTSHLALDTDGTPYFSQGSMSLSIHADTDGNPFFLDN